MSAARDAILRRIGDALAVPLAPPEVPRDYRPARPATPADLARFAERVADYRATVRKATVATLPGMLATILAERGVRTLVVPAGLPDAWLATAAASGLERLSDDPPLSREALDAADAVVTTCAIAIAETGTIVLDAGSGQGRRALSLLPDRHLCVVRAEQVVADLPDALPRLDPRRPLTWISGPSATSDIELQRVEGVHGPRILDVVIVAD